MFADIIGWFFSGHNWTGPQGAGARIVEHLGLVAGVVLIVAVIALPLGSWTGHTRFGRSWVVSSAGAARAVPTLGLLTIFALWLGIGLSAPILALVVLGLPSLLTAADAGIAEVDPEVVSAARATGLTEWQLMARVELPLAAPVILGGLRSTVLQVVSTATLAAYITDIGLGRYIFSGLKSRDYPEMFAGAALVMALSIGLEILLGIVQRRSRSRTGLGKQQHPPRKKVL